MVTDTPPDWVLLEAAKRSGYSTANPAMTYRAGGAFRALCDMIAKHEEKPVDRKLLCAREAMLLDTGTTDICVRAIELWVEGYGQ